MLLDKLEVVYAVLVHLFDTGIIPFPVRSQTQRSVTRCMKAWHA